MPQDGVVFTASGADTIGKDNTGGAAIAIRKQLWVRAQTCA